MLPDQDADLIAIPDRGIQPAEVLVTASFRDVEMVMSRGAIRLASPAIFDRLPVPMRSGLNPIDVDGTVRWIRAPIPDLLADAQACLGPEIRLGGRRLSVAR